MALFVDDDNASYVGCRGLSDMGFDLPSSSTAYGFHKGLRSAMWHWTFVVLGASLVENNGHVDRHSGQEYIAVRGGEHLLGIPGIEDLKVSRHDFFLTRAFLELYLNLSHKGFNTAFRREREDPAQGIFNSDRSLKAGEAGVNATNTVSQFMHDGINLLRRYAGLHVSARPP